MKKTRVAWVWAGLAILFLVVEFLFELLIVERTKAVYAFEYLLFVSVGFRLLSPKNKAITGLIVAVCMALAVIGFCLI